MSDTPFPLLNVVTVICRACSTPFDYRAGHFCRTGDGDYPSGSAVDLVLDYTGANHHLAESQQQEQAAVQDLIDSDVRGATFESTQAMADEVRVRASRMTPAQRAEAYRRGMELIGGPEIATLPIVLGHPATPEWCAAVDEHYRATEQHCRDLAAEIGQLKQDLQAIKDLAHPISDPLNVAGGTVACCYRMLDQINGIATVALNPALHWMRKTATPPLTDTSPSASSPS